jgi:hypothetical protein
VKPRYLVALTAAGLLLVGPAGCGIPAHTDVRVDGGGQARGGGATGVTGREAPKRMDSPSDVKQFALNFLAAAAGEARTADDRVRGFLSPGDWGRLPDTRDASINVVRLVEEEPTVTRGEGTSTVSMEVQQVGVLRPNGVLDPPKLTDTSYTFRVGNLNSGDIVQRDETLGLYVYDPPPLLMSVDALNEFYEQQTIYFWSDEENPRLVPDLRYLPVSVPSGLRPTEVLGWLTGGPADWLKGSVAELPAGTQTIGNAPANDGQLVVNLAAPALSELQVKRLATQLAWSLREIYPRGQLKLMIRDKSVRVFDVDQQRLQNPAYEAHPPGDSIISSYCVLAGAIYRVAEPGDPGDEPLPFDAARNRDIATATIARDRGSVLAALVTTTGRLLVGAGNPAVNPAATDFSMSNQVVGQQARPVWLRGFGPDGPVGLVVAGGRLHWFDVDAQLEPLQLRGAPGPVTAVSAAEDGRRIAVIAGGRLFVASLNASTRESQVRPVPVSLVEPTAVTWTAENDLVVAGQNGRGKTVLVDVTVDGGDEQPRLDDDLGTATVNYLAAYPYNPVRGDGPLLMYEANGAVWSGAAPQRVGVDQLQGANQATVAGATPTAPFFLY